MPTLPGKINSNPPGKLQTIFFQFKTFTKENIQYKRKLKTIKQVNDDFVARSTFYQTKFSNHHQAAVLLANNTLQNCFDTTRLAKKCVLLSIIIFILASPQFSYWSLSSEMQKCADAGTPSVLICFLAVLFIAFYSLFLPLFIHFCQFLRVFLKKHLCTNMQAQSCAVISKKNH